MSVSNSRNNLNKLFIKLRYPIDEIRKANADYTKYETYFNERMV